MWSGWKPGRFTREQEARAGHGWKTGQFTGMEELGSKANMVRNGQGRSTFQDTQSKDGPQAGRVLHEKVKNSLAKCDCETGA